MPFKFSIIFSQQFAWQENCHSRGLRRDAQWWLDVASSGTTRKGKSRNPRCLGSHDEKSVEPWHLSCGMDHLIIACQMSYLYTYIYITVSYAMDESWMVLGGLRMMGPLSLDCFVQPFPCFCYVPFMPAFEASPGTASRSWSRLCWFHFHFGIDQCQCRSW